MIDDLTNVREAFLRLGGLSIPVVHIAGSKGKGTTATLLAKIIEMNGERVGLFTSPALVREEEQISVQGITIPTEDLDRLSQTVRAVDDTLSPFEVLTLAAFRYFEEQTCDLVILECGWGGRWDATNVVDLKALTILTHMELEHTAVLGSTVLEIARNKLGICRPGVPLLTPAQQDPAVFEALRLEGMTPQISSDFVLGHHHPESAGLAICAAELLGYSMDSVIEETLAKLVLPGRFEVVSFGIHTLLLDGAHTFDSMSSFLERMRSFQVEKQLPEPFFAVHLLKDKAENVLDLFPVERTVWIPLHDERAREKPDFLSAVELPDLLQRLKTEPEAQLWVFTGSFRLLTPLKKMLK